jgi:hypothetical protein
VDDRRVLAAQLEYGRGQVLRGRLVNDLPDGRTPREEDEVPVLVEQRRRPPVTAATASVSRNFGIISASTAADASETSEGFTTAMFPAAIADTSGPSVSMNSSPRPDDERHPERVAAHAHVTGLHHDRRGLVPRLDPVVQVRERELGLADVDVDVHEIGVGLVAAKVVPQRVAHRVAVRFDHSLDRLQLLDPPRHGPRLTHLEIPALALDKAGVVGGAHRLLLSGIAVRACSVRLAPRALRARPASASRWLCRPARPTPR